MKYRTMGKLGIQASAFGLGCMRFNGEASGDSTINEEKAISLIRRAIDGGVTYLDTAYVYLDKTSEIVLGKALLDGYRDKVTIATKMPKEAVHDRASMQDLLDTETTCNRFQLGTEHTDVVLIDGDVVTTVNIGVTHGQFSDHATDDVGQVQTVLDVG